MQHIILEEPTIHARSNEGRMNTDELKRVYAESAVFVKLNAIFRFFIAAAFAIGGLVMALFLLLIAKVPTIVDVIVLIGCLAAGAFNAWKGYQDYKGKPTVFTAKILKKDQRMRTVNGSSVAREYYLKLDVKNAYSVDPKGNKTALPNLCGQHTFSASNVLFDKVNELEEMALVATPTHKVFAKLSDFVTGI